jgi:hypothetical protein
MSEAVKRDMTAFTRCVVSAHLGEATDISIIAGDGETGPWFLESKSGVASPLHCDVSKPSSKNWNRSLTLLIALVGTTVVRLFDAKYIKKKTGSESTDVTLNRGEAVIFRACHVHGTIPRRNTRSIVSITFAVEL